MSFASFKCPIWQSLNVRHGSIAVIDIVRVLFRLLCTINHRQAGVIQMLINLLTKLFIIQILFSHTLVRNRHKILQSVSMYWPYCFLSFHNVIYPSSHLMYFSSIFCILDCHALAYVVPLIYCARNMYPVILAIGFAFVF